ncbi:MAG: hypothetical protein E7172_06070 [Firmicutes bacterium]|nr:hypothetical protein [Bacillota bacterium]
MFEIKSYVVYKKEVCLIEDIIVNDKNKQKYYLLNPIDDNSLKIRIPVDNGPNLLRNLISKEQIDSLIKDIKNIEPLDINQKNIENQYKELLATESHHNLVKIIKTTHLRNENRIHNHKKIGDKDRAYFEKAEKYLYNEIACVLNLNYEEAKAYVMNNV